MKRLGVVAALVLAVGALWYLQHPRSSPAVAADAPPPPPPPRPSSRGAAAATKPIDAVTKLATADERKQLADRITSAQAAHAAAPIPRLPDSPSVSKFTFQSAMHELIPYIKDCYEDALPTLATPDLTVLTRLSLTGDPEVGTIVDVTGLDDKAGKPLPQAFDDCLRNVLQLMAIPPLAEGDKILVTYPFKFRQN